jgi:hypothetical protein
LWFLGFAFHHQHENQRENNENLNAFSFFRFFFFLFAFPSAGSEWGPEIFHLSNRMMMMMIVLDMKFLRLKGTCLLDFSKQHFGAERGGLHRQPRMTLRMREAGRRWYEAWEPRQKSFQSKSGKISFENFDARAKAFLPPKSTCVNC